MKIGILGCRGIPNHYGGFEQLAQNLSTGLLKKGHEVSVYNSSLHAYKKDWWNGVNIIHCKDWENKFGTAGQFFYDLNCINDARKRNFDVLLHLGYTSDSIWHWRWPKKAINIMNMDGLEWKRVKYSKSVKFFLKKAESLASNKSAVLIADSPVIQKYLLIRYNKDSVYIPYGATIFNEPDASILKKFGLDSYQYFLMIARMEPENNIETVIKGYIRSGKKIPLVIIGNYRNKYGRYLKTKYQNNAIIFPGAIYEQAIMNNLRFFSTVYFHGHSVGGTNPALLDAMACQCNIAAHDNEFNRYVLDENAEYFSSPGKVETIMNLAIDQTILNQRKKINLSKIESNYNWPGIIAAYEKVMLDSISALR